MKPILEEAITGLRLVRFNCKNARSGGLLRCESEILEAMQRSAEVVISKYEAEKRRQRLGKIIRIAFKSARHW